MIEDLATHPCRFVTIPEFAAYLESIGMPVTERTLYHHRFKGALATITRGGMIFIRIEEACKYAEVRYRGPRAADPKAVVATRA